MSSAGTAAMTLGYMGATVEVCAGHSDLAWLEEFLCPPFAHSGADAPGHRVRFSAEPRRHAALLARGPEEQARRLPCFAFDRRAVDYAVWHGEASETVLFDPEFMTFYVIRGVNTEVEVVAHRKDRWPRVALMRVVREIAMAHAETQGAVPVHGAAVALAGRAAILAGPKRSGKTSLLVHALLHPGARLIANDRLMLSAGDGAWRVTGMPTVVNVRPGTRALFAEVFGGIGEDPTLASLSARERATHAASGRRDDGALVLNPLQLCEIVGTERIADAEPCAIVLPRVDEAGNGIALRRLDEGEALDRLNGAIFPSAVRLLYRGTDGADPPETVESAGSILARAARNVPCFDCALGRNAYTAESRTEFFARIFGSIS